MKKLISASAVFLMILGLTWSAQAATTIDFEGLGWGTVLSDQFSVSDGITFTGSNQITAGTDSGTFNRPFDSYGDVLQYSQQGTDLVISLTEAASSLGFIYRRPSGSGNFDVELFSNGSLVDEFNVAWSSGDTTNDALGWGTFLFSGADFDQIVLYSNNKFVIDNLTLNAVPVPGTLVLLMSGLLPIATRYRRK